MRKLLPTLAAIPALFLVAPLMSSSAQAAPLAIPAMDFAEPPSLLQQVDFDCRPVWRCGYWGCGWTRACGWRRDPDDFYRPYRRFDRDDWRYRRDRW
jgi:hypothetical protein